VALGANDAQTIRTLIEAEKYDGPSLIIAYSPCIAHGFDLADQLKHQEMAVKSGYWMMMRYNPMLAAEGKNPLIIDSKAPTLPVKDYIFTENRYRQLQASKPELADELATVLQKNVNDRWAFYSYQASQGSTPEAPQA